MPSERAVAKAAGHRTYFTGKPCKHGHLADRQTLTGVCLKCSAVSTSKWAARNQGKRAATHAAWRSRNMPLHNARGCAWREASPGKAAAAILKWKADNRGRTAATEAKRRASQLSRTPLWADQVEIERAYARAKLLTAMTGEQYDVDHVVPLQGKNVSGLHVHYNLRVVPHFANVRKSNAHV